MPRRIESKLTLALGIICLLAVSSPAWSQASHPKANNALISDAQAVSVQKQFFDAMIAGDGHAMEALSADDLNYVHLNGMQQTKKEFLAWVANMQFKKFDLQEYKIHAYPNSFVLNGTVENTRGMHLRLTTVWEQKPAGWQMVLLQYTEVPEPKAAAPKPN